MRSWTGASGRTRWWLRAVDQLAGVPVFYKTAKRSEAVEVRAEAWTLSSCSSYADRQLLTSPCGACPWMTRALSRRTLRVPFLSHMRPTVPISSQSSWAVSLAPFTRPRVAPGRSTDPGPRLLHTLTSVSEAIVYAMSLPAFGASAR
jgi:hypothetical protein